jgi:hypothetical protein
MPRVEENADAERTIGLVFGPYTFVDQVQKWKCTKSKRSKLGTASQRRCLRGHFETVPTSDTTWYGCGRKATQNALRYFGIAIAQAEII